MAAFSTFFILWCAICSLVYGADQSFTISARRAHGDRATVNAVSEIRKRQTGTVPSALGKSLYWFGNFSVGDSGSLLLLIDTGSSDLLVNPGLYKPSKHAKPYKQKKFSITYEGVNRQGFGFETINGTLERDVVTSAGLTVPDQPVGDIKTFQYKDTRPLHHAIEGQGIIGFLGVGSSSFKSPSWVFRLCRDKLISQCRFALAFGTSGKGLTVIGKIAKNLFEGPLTVAPNLEPPGKGSWIIKGDVAISDKIVFKNQTIIMDVGTDNIQAPFGVAKKIFETLGYQAVVTNGGPNPFNPKTDLKVIQAFFPCDKPPKLGFSFPSQSTLQTVDSSEVSKKSKLFNVSPKVWGVYDHGNNNCTSILGGTNALGTGENAAWLLGQSFFSGHYVDFDITGATVSFANLKDPSMASA